ncbi:GlsB/YeaQ/YmgE family stress response membrane protein [Lactobacillus crispatus]|uniref:GlsB/YeaQ/YmgE family stress response membrane protein n=1 Tax=Lactobacillus crispatus TaxID=47770 RepID=UPI0022B3C920|nr:GlsB/YeaQ/YmgE family stress response membrane protein [Lactobacillus crispatus]WAZ54636.1 GlsB/YeaQ/YmgE family stress response membrane protein [Lactobacillus crispatus]
MLSWIWVLIVGAIIGLIAGFITGKGGSMGFLANLIAGLVGSTLGQAIFGSWGAQMAGMAIVPSILGAVILVLVVSFVLGMLRKTE